MTDIGDLQRKNLEDLNEKEREMIEEINTTFNQLLLKYKNIGLRTIGCGKRLDKHEKLKYVYHIEIKNRNFLRISVSNEIFSEDW